MMSKAKLNDETRQKIKELYQADDKLEVIYRTITVAQVALEMGMNCLDVTLRLHDLGVKPEEQGFSMAYALKHTDDAKLSEKDIEVKKILIVKFKDMLDQMETEL